MKKLFTFFVALAASTSLWAEELNLHLKLKHLRLSNWLAQTRILQMSFLAKLSITKETVIPLRGLDIRRSRIANH